MRMLTQSATNKERWTRFCGMARASVACVNRLLFSLGLVFVLQAQTVDQYYAFALTSTVSDPQNNGPAYFARIGEYRFSGRRWRGQPVFCQFRVHS